MINSAGAQDPRNILAKFVGNHAPSLNNRSIIFLWDEVNLSSCVCNRIWENSMKKRTQSYKTCFDAFRIKMKREWSAVDSYEMLPKETYFTKEETFRHSNNNNSLWKVGSLLYSYYSTNCQFVLLKYKLTPFNLWIATTSLIVCPE